MHTPKTTPSIWNENKSGNVSSYPYSCALRAGASYNYLLVNGERRLTEPIDKDTLLEAIHFDKSWYKIVSDRIPDKTDALRQRDRINDYVEKITE